MATTNEAKFTISAEDRFSRVMSTLKSDLASSKEQLAGIGTAAGAVNAALGRIAFGGIAGAAGFIAGVKSVAHDLDALNDVADATGASIENLSALEDVARRNGESLEVVGNAVLRLNKALNDTNPDSPIAQALKAIGLSTKELRDLDPAVALQRVAQALDQYAAGGNKARLEQLLLEKSTKTTAAFLKDLAEAGELNAKVTTKQAEEAERFNKALYAMSTNASNAGRALVSELLPGLNEIFLRISTAREVFGGFAAAMRASTSGEQFADAAQGVDFYTKELAKLQAQREKLAGNAGNAFAREAAKDLDPAIEKARQLLDFYTRIAVATGKFAGAGRGFVNPEPAVTKPQAPQIPDKPAEAAKVSEAQRLLDMLEKQWQAEAKLTDEEKVRLEIEKKLDGLTPALERRIINVARLIDGLRDVNKELEREAGFEKLLTDKRQGDINATLGLLEQTPTGQRDRISRQADQITQFAAQNPEDARIQRQASEALAALKKQMDDLTPSVAGASKGFAKFADDVDASMKRSTDAVIDFVAEGRTDLGSLFHTFKRDLLRQMIEDPIRDSMKSAVAIIRKELAKLGEGGNPFAQLATWLKDIFSSSGGGGPSILSSIANLFSGSTGRAGGGSVRAGQLVRWQENGKEWFVPGSDGTVVNPAQQKALGAGSMTFAPVVNVNGDVSQQTVALVQAMLAKQQAAFIRSARTGGAFALS